MITTHKGPNLYLAMRYSIDRNENGTLSYIGERTNKQTNKRNINNMNNNNNNRKLTYKKTNKK